MGRWAQARKRGTHKPGDSCPAAAVATAVEGVGVTWEYPVDCNPFQWLIQSSVDGVTEWEDDDSVGPNARVYSPPGHDFFYRVGRLLEGSIFIGEWSNVVFLANDV